eukprot:TRINITY_DN14070_c0_g1_i1.p1 TRINITY_DN14070_c0_g1~~TRINITY_DN14070_c0_g1_i1.p1  ORF type:complete len:497 (-),score=119.32 TRINITY_DN14070_c0_g1_i1:104-1594(-)
MGATAYKWGFLMVLTALAVSGKRRKSSPPHLIMILADDLGWNDVSWHNTLMLTPRMEGLMRSGVELTQSYVTPKCSPSRAALMTGRYPWRLGMQRGAVERYQPDGLNASIKLLPEYLKKGGYSTHAVGKWHLGYCHPDYLPQNRGFDSFFGQWNHVTNYYTRKTEFLLQPDTPAEKYGYDLHQNDEIVYEGKDEFMTDLLTRKARDVIEDHDKSKPLFLYLAYQAPHSPIMKPPEKYLQMYNALGRFQNPGDEKKLNRAATITALDTGVGAVVDALKSAGLYENSVVVFSTDNGGAILRSSNLPLRGDKEQLYEGGIRGVGFVLSPLLKKPETVNDKLMFISDWFSTFLSLAGLSDQIPQDTDSFDMWKTISKNNKSPRSEIILNLDQDNFRGLWSAAIRSDNFKLIWGQDKLLKKDQNEKSCNVELYNIKNDPSERNNLAPELRKKVAELKDRLMSQLGEMTPAIYSAEKREGWPGYFEGKNKGMFSTGWCNATV